MKAVCATHPTYAAGCPGCRAAGAARARNRTRLIAYSQWDGMVDSAEVVAHIKQLIAAGMSRRGIAEQSGVGKSAVSRLASGVQAVVTGTAARKILAVRVALPPFALVSSLGSARRLRALMAAGWDSASLATRLGTSINQVRRWRWQAQPTVRNDVHQRICALYRELEHRPGPSAMARRQALALGYRPPICWDDDGDLDDVRGRPKGFRKNQSPLMKEQAA